MAGSDHINNSGNGSPAESGVSHKQKGKSSLHDHSRDGQACCGPSLILLEVKHMMNKYYGYGAVSHEQ